MRKLGSIGCAGLLTIAFGTSGCDVLLATEGGRCDTSDDCEEGLTCSSGWCTGSGTTPLGDPCNGTIDCTPGSICWNDICVGVGALRFSLAWTEDTDFDLHVETPGGSEIYYSNRAADGGELDVDDCIGGSCVNQDGTHVENIVFLDDAPAGTYTFWVHNYSGTTSGTFTIDVFEGPELVASKSGTLPASNVDSEHYAHTK